MAIDIKQKLVSWNKHPFLVIGALIAPFVLFVVGYMFAYIPIAGHFEKKEFVAAEKKLDELQAAIIANIGEPSKSEKKSSCGYSSAKFEGGRLGCGVYVTLAYPTSNELEATRQYDKILSAIESSDKFEITYRSGSEFPALDHPYNPKRIELDLTRLNKNIRCSGHVEYGASGGGIVLSSENSEKSIAFSFGCGGESLREHFPVEK